MDDREKYEKLYEFKKKSPKNEYMDYERSLKIDRQNRLYNEHLETFKGINLEGFPSWIINKAISEKYIFTKSVNRKDFYKWVDETGQNIPGMILDIEKAYEFILWHDPLAMEIEKYEEFETERKRKEQDKKQIKEEIPDVLRANLGLDF